MPVIQTETGGRPAEPKTAELEVEFAQPEESLKVEAPPEPSSESAVSEAEEGLTESELEVELEASPESAASSAADTAVTAKELVPVYLLAMHLPSADLIADDYTDADRGFVRRIKEWRGENAQRVAREIETMRRSVYRRIERLWCMVKEFGVWITVSEEGLREAERISKEVRGRLHQLGLGEVAHRYFVRAIRVYLEPSDAKMLLDALSREAEELESRIKDAENRRNRRLVKELTYKREYVKHLLATIRKYIEDINS